MCDIISSIVSLVILSYICSLIIYNISEMWRCGRNKLLQYREHKKSNRNTYITGEFEAIKRGMFDDFVERFVDSLIWPMNIIPFLILLLNPDNEDNDDYKDNMDNKDNIDNKDNKDNMDNKDNKDNKDK